MAPLESIEAYAVLDAASGKTIDANNEYVVALPGSTVKPFLPRTLRVFPCDRTLRIGQRRLDCTHPPVYGPINFNDALQLSCNCYFAALALSMPSAHLQLSLAEFGAKLAVTPEQRQLEALGHWGVRATPLLLARAYRRLLLSGLWTGFSGKTGTTRYAAWYAGWAPPENPTLVLAVMTGGRGATDAAPAAQKLFSKWLR